MPSNIIIYLIYYRIKYLSLYTIVSGRSTQIVLLTNLGSGFIFLNHNVEHYLSEPRMSMVFLRYTSNVGATQINLISLKKAMMKTRSDLFMLKDFILAVVRARTLTNL